MIQPDLEYIRSIRRELHEHPETGFDLPNTAAVVRRELDAMGIPYTEQYGTCSLIATIAPGEGRKRIGIRADMDALPIQEETGLPFASKVPGKMHACGHDCHTAMLLGTAKALKQMESELKCTVKLVFQPAEETCPSGAQMMCENGAQAEFDEILCTHMASNPTGTIELNDNTMSASCQNFRIVVHGKTAHVATPHNAVDAIAIASQIVTAIQILRARQFRATDALIIGIGTIHGGTASNVVCDRVTMDGTIRAFTKEVAEKAYERLNALVPATAEAMGGTAEVEWMPMTPPVQNDPVIAGRIMAIGRELLGEENARTYKAGMGAEDFAFFLEGKPGIKFQLGAHGPEMPPYVGHNSRLMIDENALDIAPRIFIEYVTRYWSDRA